MAGEVDPGFSEIARRFSDLWRAITHDGSAQRTDGMRRLLADRVRDALDRGQSRLDGEEVTILANSFTLIEQVHEGQLAQVYRARHRDLGSQHAVKLLHPAHANNPVARDLFLREARVGISLCHPNIVPTQVLLRLSDARQALVIGWCEQSLADRLARQEDLAVEDVVLIIAGVLEGLTAIHAASIIHCDLSPSNILFKNASATCPKIGDFGIALAMGEHHRDLDLAHAGRAEFSAPEQKQGDRLDPRADLFAAGKILRLLLLRCREEAPLDRLWELVDHLTQPKPVDRPEHAQAALHALRDSRRALRL
jgi:type VI secretion system protein ImpN